MRGAADNPEAVYAPADMWNRRQDSGRSAADIIFEKVKIKNKQKTTKTDLIELLKTKKIDVLVTFGAGDIEVLVPEIKKLSIER